MTTRPDAWIDHSSDDRRAIERVFAGLERGFNEHDAEAFNRSFAHDVIWGSPYGGTVNGYDHLHAIHQRFAKNTMAKAHSRYTLVNLVFASPEVAVAHVRREATDERGQVIDPTRAEQAHIFHELAMFVLVKRDGAWWIAAGHNTPIRPDPFVASH